jgi:hypothetical protein
MILTTKESGHYYYAHVFPLVATNKSCHGCRSNFFNPLADSKTDKALESKWMKSSTPASE